MNDQNNEPEPIEIELGNSGLISWVDEEDRDVLAKDWILKSAGNKDFPHYYAVNRWKIGGKWGEEYLHNVIWERMMGTPVPRGFLVDHINRDKLDNRRCNLRLATRAQNEANKRKRRTQAGGKPSSKYKGVSYRKGYKKKPWRAVINYEKRYINIGNFKTEIEAAKAYNEAAKKYFGEFAFLNEITENTTE